MICLEEEFEDTKGGNQNPYIEEELTAQWPKEKGQTTIYKHTHKTKDRVTRTPLKSGGELRCSGRLRSSFSTSGTRHVTLVTNVHMIREKKKCKNDLISLQMYAQII